MSTVPRINDLAAEVLGHIFELRQEGTEDDGRALLQLVCVCKYWKEVSLGHPQLWSAVECSLPRWESDWIIRMPGIIASLKRWFGRAGDLPLKLHTTFNLLPQSDLRLFEFLAGCSRWGTLRFTDLRVHEPLDWGWMILLLGTGSDVSQRRDTVCWPALKTLAVHSPWGNLYLNDSPLLSLDSLAPNLENFFIHYAVIEASDRFVETLWLLPWASLTSLSISGVLERGCCSFLLSLLENAQNLRKMKVTENRGPTISANDPAIDSPPLSHPRLQHLSLDIREGALKPFFQNIRFPALRSVELRCRDQGYNPRAYSRFLNWSLEEACKNPEFWPHLDKFTLILGDNLIELREGDPGFPILKQAPYTWYILAGTPFGTS